MIVCDIKGNEIDLNIYFESNKVEKMFFDDMINLMF